MQWQRDCPRNICNKTTTKTILVSVKSVKTMITTTTAVGKESSRPYGLAVLSSTLITTALLAGNFYKGRGKGQLNCDNFFLN